MKQQWLTLPELGVPRLHGEFILRRPGEHPWRIAHWRDGFVCERRLPGRWVRFRRDPGLLLAWPRRWGPALREFMSAVPLRFLETAARFEHRQFTVLRLMRLAPGSADLAQDCPALFWSLADLAGGEEFSCQEAAEWTLRPRREIIRLLLGEDCVYTPTFMRKIRPLCYSQETFSRLRRFLLFYRTNPDVLHLRRIAPDCFPAGLAEAWGLSDKRYFLRGLERTSLAHEQCRLLETMLTRAGLVSTGTIKEGPVRKRPGGVAGGISLHINGPTPEEMAARWKDVQRMSETLERDDMLEALQRAESHARVMDLHKHLLHDLHADGYLVGGKAMHENLLPRPPLPGDERIQPILTVDDLEEEGRIMRHCAADMAAEAMQGHVAFYRVFSPQRATLMLDLHFTPPCIGELKTYGNAEVRDETVRVVERWLSHDGKDCSSLTSFH